MGQAELSRRLVVNADDFGASPSVNQAVVQAHQQGILTTASLMVNAPACAEAVALARANPQLGVGLHLTLACGTAALAQTQIPHLVDAKGEFSDSPVRAGFRYFFNRSAALELEREIEAQFEKFTATRLPLDHVNGHLHFHLHPSVLGIVSRLSARFGIRAMRLTYDPWDIDRLINSGHWLYRMSHACMFTLLARRARRIFADHGFRCTERVFGLLRHARVDAAYVRRLLPRLPPGDSELYSHPSLEEFKHEFDALLNPEVIQTVRQRGIILIRYQDL